MKDFAEWFAMGGYSLYVWPAYGMAAVLLIGNLVAARRRRRDVERQLRAAPPPVARNRP